ncbi:MAG: TerB family tellurite resistance protein [Deltaproteobacteria bacterium]|nr:TerB family tellurite resistance protein [Deltaproteobacteria bacterium]
MDAKDKLAICKLVAHAILVDGQLTDAEHDLLDRLMERYGLDDAQRAEVRDRNITEDPLAMVKEVSESGHEDLLQELAAAVCVDEEISGREKNLLRGVARTLGLDEEEADAAFIVLTKV